MQAPANPFKWVLALTVLLIWTAEATSATWTVRKDGSGDFTSIQSALSAAANGDVVLVGDGDYPEDRLRFSGKSIELRSENGPANCRVGAGFGPMTGSIFVFDSTEGPGAVVDGFTIMNGWATRGGGIHVLNASSPTIANNVITGNHADQGGGICVWGSGSPSFLNNLIVSNDAAVEGGGLAFYFGTLLMRNNTLAYNTAPSGSGMKSSASPIDATDNIIWGNLGGTQLVGGIAGTFQYNLVAGISGIPTNFDGNPMFSTGPLGNYYCGSAGDAVDTGSQDVSLSCFPLGASSLCMGDLTTSTGPFFDTGTVDVGYHYPRVPTDVLVPTQYPDIASAVAGAISGDVIHLAAGNYSGPGNRDILIDGKALSIVGPSTGAAVINCSGSAVEPHRAFRLENQHQNLVFRDLTIKYGYSGYGGAVLVANASPEFYNCTFTRNHAVNASGAIHVPGDSRLVLEDCTFRENTTDNAGGALTLGTDQVVIRRCVFHINDAYWGGGGIYFNNGGGTIEDCLFWGNSSTYWGGAFHVQNYSLPVFTRCTFYQNSAGQGGVAFARNNATASLDHCILSHSLAGAATYCTSGGTLTLTCSDVWMNAGGTDYSGCISGMEGVDGNIRADPLYCDPMAGEFALEVGSPCAAGGTACGQMGWSAATCVTTDVPDAGLVVADLPYLHPSRPNPFNPATELTFDLPSGFHGRVEVIVFDLAGRRVATLLEQELAAGTQRVVWHGTDDRGEAVASGVYVARLRTDNHVAQRKLALVR